MDLAELRPYDPPRLGRILDYMAARSMVCRPELEAHADRLRAALPHVARIDQLLAERPDKGRPLGSEFEAMLLPPLRKAGVPLPEHQSGKSYRTAVRSSLTSRTPSGGWPWKPTATSGIPRRKRGGETGSGAAR